MIAVVKLHTRKGGSASWGRPGDELLLHAAVDECDPAYDSADELFATAFEAMREDWLHQASVELAEVEDEGEEFFSRDDPARR